MNEETLLGTAGTLLKNRATLCSDRILMAHADNISLIDLKKFILAHEAKPDGCLMTLLTFKTATLKIVELCSLMKKIG